MTGIVLALAPESASGMKKYLKNIVSLVLLCVLIMPIVPVITNVESLGQTIEENAARMTEAREISLSGEARDRSNELILNQNVRNINREIAVLINQTFKIKTDDIEITLTLNDDDITNIIISRIDIIIRGENANAVTAALVCEYVKKYFTCECGVTCG